MSKLSLKEIAMQLESGVSSDDIKGEDIQDGAFAKLWDEWKEVSNDSYMLRDKITEYINPYFTK